MKMDTLKSKAAYLLFICIFGTCVSSFAQVSRFSAHQYVNGMGDTLNYRLLFPDANPFRKYPLVIFLHGSGERGSDNNAQLKWGVENFATDEAMSKYPALVIAPQCPAGQQWSHIKRTDNTRDIKMEPTPAKSMELLMELIQKTIKEMPVDTNRIYITGLSMGGYGTFEALARYPNLFAAAVPVCGGGDTSKAAVIAQIPIWILHGAEDSAVSPLYGLDMVNALTKAGGRPGFTLYPEVGHFSWLMAYSDPLVMEWLFRQRKHGH